MVITYENCKVERLVKNEKNDNHYATVKEPYARADLNLTFKSAPEIKTNVEGRLTLIGQLGEWKGKYFFTVESFKQG